MPRDHFGRRYHVRTHSVDARRLDEHTRRSIVVQNAPPPPAGGSAVPRGTLSVPGVMGGNVRREAPTVDRDGEVRRPSAGAAAGAIAPDGSRSRTPQRTGDAPVYAPQYTPPPAAQTPPPQYGGYGAVRRDGARDGHSRRGGDAPARGTTAAPPAHVPAATPPARGPAPEARPPAAGGAVERGSTGRSAPAPAPAPPTAAAGGAVDRSGASRRPPPEL